MLAALFALSPCAALAAAAYIVKPFKVDFSSELPHLKALLATTRVAPPHRVAGSNNASFGITTGQFAHLRDQWRAFDWDAEQARLNSYKQFTTVIEDITVHFVHERSSQPGAIPLVITHGWPGSFAEYLPVVRPLLQPSRVGNKTVSFDVVIASVPGFTFSSVPSTLDGRTVQNTARLWNKLMVELLGYTNGYAVAGSDWGGLISWYAYDLFPASVRAAYVTFLPFVPPDLDQVAADNQTLSAFELAATLRTEELFRTAQAYFTEQTTKPSTIGLALQDSPLGQLAWMGEKFILFSDPKGDLQDRDILEGVSLYYLSGSFLSSVFEYPVNTLEGAPRKANNDAPLGYGNFKWDVGHWPKYFVAETGNLVFYSEHEKGGHFPGLDNPDDWVKDVRTMMAEHFAFTGKGDISPALRLQTTG